ncbi:VOC family protein [Macrococcus capreoli]|uniref:VOC family protein n=1 Tax=Macrococcus capreoli TaxID=2982690 RepID=UPI003EE6481F
MSQKIVPCLWFDTEAKEAAELYTSLFPKSKIMLDSKLEGTPSGEVSQLTFEIMGFKFYAMSAGPYFKKNPSISFMVSFKSSEIDTLKHIFDVLKQGGNVVMDLKAYPFSPLYAWVEDKYGVSWQLIVNDNEDAQRVKPTLLFNNDNTGKCEAAVDYYLSVFKDAQKNAFHYYPENMAPNLPTHVMHGEFVLEGITFCTMDSAYEYDYQFNEGVSLIIYADDQAEIDYYWEQLSHDSKAEQCGWLKDKYGVSWQVTPSIMDDMMNGTEEQIKRVTEAFLQMKKFDIAALEAAYKGEN